MKYPLRDTIPYTFDIFFNRFNCLLSTIVSVSYIKWWNIKIGKNNKFFGIVHLSRHPNGIITIGDNSIFRSAESSNSIGINRRCFLSAGPNAKLQIGNNCGFSGTIISSLESITIGDNVLCGANCTIIDNDRHPIDSLFRNNSKSGKKLPIFINDGVFLGMNVVVLKGVTIGKNTVVGANSLVLNSLPENILAGGNPARFIRNI